MGKCGDEGDLFVLRAAMQVGVLHFYSLHPQNQSAKIFAKSAQMF